MRRYGGSRIREERRRGVENEFVVSVMMMVVDGIDDGVIILWMMVWLL